ncbi:Uncharacterised protein [Mycoplasmopsis maculosa]|uniref:Lipoprotein n=1 Tax=Mycoplasmopsis maculosa TaxID=114885 RepID=A0A449B3J2_9BACT|nr:hypothetical protein [Mycoplasmopsis maculosa]VEU75157.1 Uncharacterised protein [Mycoplasmopsis maculosa]
MKINKKIIIPISTLPFLMVSCSNLSTNKENSDVENKAKNLKIELLENKNIEEALKIESYKITKIDNYVFNLISIEKISENSVKINYSLIDIKNNYESKIYTKEFNRISNNVIFDNKKDILKGGSKNGIEIDKMFQIFELFNFSNENLPSENADLISIKNNADLEIKQFSIFNLNDMTGELSIKFSGKYKNEDFYDLIVNFSGSKKLNTSLQSIKYLIDYDYIFENKINIDNLEAYKNKDFLNFFSELKFSNYDNKTFDIKKMQSENKLIINDLSFLNGKSNKKINLNLNIKNIFYENGIQKEDFYNITRNSFFEINLSFNDYEYLNYVLNNKIIIYEDLSFISKNTYASKLWSDFKLTNEFLANFYEFEQGWDNFKNEKLKVKVINVIPNDIKGEVIIYFVVKVADSDSYEEIKSIEERKLVITGFKKITNELLLNNIFIQFNHEYKDITKLAKNIKSSYDNSNDKQNFKIEGSDLIKYVGYFQDENLWIPIVDLGINEKNESRINKSSRFNLYFGSEDLFNSIDTQNGTNFLTSENGDLFFSISRLEIEFLKIHNIEIRYFEQTNKTRVYLELELNIKIGILSGTETNSMNANEIIITKNVSSLLPLD